MSEFVFDESLKAVLAELDKIPAKIEQNIVRGALRAAAKPMLEAAQTNVPVKSGALRDSIRISSNVDRRAGEIKVTVKAGGKTKKGDPYYAHMVEFGTKPHVIKGPVRFNGKWYMNLQHPGSRPSGFMRRAFDATGGAVVEAYADYMRKRIPKELAKNGGG